MRLVGQTKPGTHVSTAVSNNRRVCWGCITAPSPSPGAGCRLTVSACPVCCRAAALPVKQPAVCCRVWEAGWLAAAVGQLLASAFSTQLQLKSYMACACMAHMLAWLVWSDGAHVRKQHTDPPHVPLCRPSVLAWCIRSVCRLRLCPHSSTAAGQQLVFDHGAVHWRSPAAVRQHSAGTYLASRLSDGT
jgi:hypothetical protein